MNKNRLEALADGIFAIVLTLIAIDIKPGAFSDKADELTFHIFIDNAGIFLSFILSFSILFMYWRSHHFLISVFASNVDSPLVNLNGLFLMFISLIPFSGRFLAEAPYSTTALITFGIHIILIGLTLLGIREYVKLSKTIKDNFQNKDHSHSFIRIVSQPIFATIGVFGALIHPSIAWSCFAIPIVFNLIPGSIDWTAKALKRIEEYMI